MEEGGRVEDWKTGKKEEGGKNGKLEFKEQEDRKMRR